MIGFLVAGLTLLFRDFHTFFKPTRPYQAIVRKAKKINLSVNSIIVIIAFLTVLLGLIKEIINVMASKAP